MPLNPRAMPEGSGLTASFATSALPLAGCTALIVEDSRYASEALRLMCQRSGARLRRADSIAAAHRHLDVYRPDFIIVDMGLPDGSGADLIADLHGNDTFFGLILASSGDPDTRGQAMAAGAAGFLDKPVESLAMFVQTILEHGTGACADLPDGQSAFRPDRQALRDDLNHAVDLIATSPASAGPYVANFVRGIARSSHDPRLETAARNALDHSAGMQDLAQAVKRRLNHAPGPFVSVDGPSGQHL